MPTNPIFSYSFTIHENVIDDNGHVNNLAYVQWMQDAAIRHGQERLAGYNSFNLENATFVAREHRIKYLSPAFVGEELEIRTWVDGIRRVRVHRRYDFIRKSDRKVIVKGETDWVYINIETGKPMALPASFLELFPILPDPS